MSAPPRHSLTDEEAERLRRRDSLPMWPEVYLTIVRVAGEERTRRLARELGGERVEFPANPRPDNRLVAILGRRAVQLLHQEFGAARVKLPGAVNYLTLCRARELRAKGKTLRQIAGLLNRDVDTISRYCMGVEPICANLQIGPKSAPRPEPPPLPLFAWRRGRRTDG
ncbi:MAG: hypothetical protein RLY86_676 [Pseudomonadota bacterium]